MIAWVRNANYGHCQIPFLGWVQFGRYQSQEDEVIFCDERFFGEPACVNTKGNGDAGDYQAYGIETKDQS